MWSYFGKQETVRIQVDLGSPRLARASPASRDQKAALTLGSEGGEVGADFCLLGNQVEARPTVVNKGSIIFYTYDTYNMHIIIALTTNF